MNTAATDGSFDFTLVRRRIVDESGHPVDSDDPAQWANEDELLESNAPPDIVGLGRGRMTVLSTDEAEFVRLKLMSEPKAGEQYIRADLRMDVGAAREPAMSDLVAVLVPGNLAVVYEVMLASADLEVPPEVANDPDAVVLVSLPRGHAILRRGPDLPIVRAGPDDEQDAEITEGGSHAQH